MLSSIKIKVSAIANLIAILALALLGFITFYFVEKMSQTRLSQLILTMLKQLICK